MLLKHFRTVHCCFVAIHYPWELHRLFAKIENYLSLFTLWFCPSVGACPGFHILSLTGYVDLCRVGPRHGCLLLLGWWHGLIRGHWVSGPSWGSLHHHPRHHTLSHPRLLVLDCSLGGRWTLTRWATNSQISLINVQNQSKTVYILTVHHVAVFLHTFILESLAFVPYM